VVWSSVTSGDWFDGVACGASSSHAIPATPRSALAASAARIRVRRFMRGTLSQERDVPRPSDPSIRSREAIDRPHLRISAPASPWRYESRVAFSLGRLADSRYTPLMRYPKVSLDGFAYRFSLSNGEDWPQKTLILLAKQLV
jgi:hypothetical protein